MNVKIEEHAKKEAIQIKAWRELEVEICDHLLLISVNCNQASALQSMNYYFIVTMCLGYYDVINPMTSYTSLRTTG